MANELEKTTETTEQTAEQPKTESSADVKALQAEIAKLKQAVTNASADASEWKKKFRDTDEALKSKMTEDEKAENERAEREAARDLELETLRNRANIADFKAQFASVGFDDTLAQEAAEALNGGNTADVFGAIRKFIDTHDRALAEKAVLNNPTLPGGDSTKTVTREQFKAMGLREMTEFRKEHPDLYNEYMNRT